MIIEAAAHRLVSPPLLVLICTLAAGCGESGQEDEEPDLRSIAAYYSQYRAEHRGQLPANEKDFRNFIRAKRSAAMGDAPSESIDSVIDELFVSNRDGKPFVVKYRGDKSWPFPEIVAYEQEGRSGTRHVATVTGGYDQWSDEKFGNNTPAAAER